MEAVRYIKKIENSHLVLDGLEQFTGQEVEIIVLPMIRADKKKSADFDPSVYKGILNLSGDVIEAELSVMRDEWERG